MPHPTHLTPAHQLLAGTAQQPKDLLDAWIALNLAQPGQADDGETDLTALRAGYSDAQIKGLNTSKDLADVAARVKALMQAGARPFDTNRSGLDAFDCWSWVESLDLVQTLLAADPPDLVALMDRKPHLPNGPVVPAPPHVWAAWALADRGDELIELHDHGWPWPQDILGWAHPQLTQDLLDRGAPWSPNVRDLWNKRVKAGDLSMGDLKAMATRCERTFGAAVDSTGRVIENGRDLVSMVRQKNNSESLLAAVQQHATLGAWTVAMQNETWPVLGRLLELSVDRKLTQKEHKKLSHLIQGEFERLAGDPEQTLGPRGPALKAVMQVVGQRWARASERDNYPSWNALAPRVEAWGGPVSLAETLTCSDTLQREQLFDFHHMKEAYEHVNGLLFKQARDRVMEGQPEDSQVALAIARAQDPCGGRGFWNADTLERLLGQSPRTGLLREMTYAPLLDRMSPAQRLLSVAAFIAATQFSDAKKYLAHVDAHLDDLDTPDQRAALQTLLLKCRATPEVIQLRSKAEALGRADQAQQVEVGATRRPRIRS